MEIKNVIKQFIILCDFYFSTTGQDFESQF